MPVSLILILTNQNAPQPNTRFCESHISSSDNSGQRLAMVVRASRYGEWKVLFWSLNK